ncbi:MAG: hypothetical protein GWP14_02740 [Actinobacteria bacterium]|nr:hypothetical protein [Actinomycetota bacterium]
MNLQELKTFLALRWRRLSWETTFIILGQAGGLAGALIGMRLLTQLLDTSTYGTVALFITLVMMSGLVYSGPLSSWMQRNLAPYRERKDLDGYFGLLGWINRCFLWLVLLCVVILMIVGTATDRWWIWPTILTVGIAYLFGANRQMMAMQSAARRRATTAVHQIAMAWLYPLLACAIVLIAGATATNTLSGFLLALVIIFASQLFFLGKICPKAGLKFAGITALKRPPAEQLKSVVWLGGPIAIWGVTGWLQLYADRWVVGYYLDLSSIGILAVSVMLASKPILSLSEVVSNLFYPIIVERAGEANSALRIQRALRVFKLEMLTFTVLASLWMGLAFVFRYWIVGLALASKFQDAVKYFPLLMLGWFFLALVMQLHQMGTLFNATRRFLVPTMSCSVMALLLAIVGTSRWGLVGTTGAFVLASGLTFLVIALTAGKLVRSKKAALQAQAPAEYSRLSRTALTTRRSYALESSAGA